jgi:hypothetical protein
MDSNHDKQIQNLDVDLFLLCSNLNKYEHQ